MDKITNNAVRESEIIPVEGGYYLSEPETGDIPQLVKYLNDEEIYLNILKIPKPYTTEDGLWFINFCKERRKMFGHTMEWCLRKQDHELIGGIGLQGSISESSHREVIGYWLARPFWNQKIMSRTLISFCQYVLARNHLIRLEAHVYPGNVASCRILEKAGFEKEGVMKKFIYKDGNYLDTCLYALVK